MTAMDLTEILTGREIGKEITSVEAQRAAESGLVVIYGYSDDNVELRGAIDEEVGAWNGTRIYVNKDGILQEPDCSSVEECVCPYFEAARRAARTIDALWHNEGGPCWTFETNIPHETFNIYEDGELFCVGIVFSMEDLEVAV